MCSQAADRQAQAAAAGDALADARTADARHTATVQAAQNALPTGGTLPPDGYQPLTVAAAGRVAAADAAVQGTTDAANRLHSEHSAAVDRCVGAINTAAGMRFQEPPGFWGRLGAAVGGWIRDNADVLTAISGALKQISRIAGLLAMIPMLAPVMAPLAAATGAGAVLIDSAVKVATGRGSWTDIAMDVAGVIPGGGVAGEAVKGAKLAQEGAKLAQETHAVVGAAETATTVGRTATTVGRTAATVGSDARGVGAAAGGVHRAEGGLVGADRSGGRAVDSAGSAVAHDTPVEDLPCVGDPVDVVTGEMVLTHTDLRLPGVLPLVLKRVYKSGYRWGRAFGSAWASTLDQRVEVGSGGNVCFVADDGVVLHYRVVDTVDLHNGTADVDSTADVGTTPAADTAADAGVDTAAVLDSTADTDTDADTDAGAGAGADRSGVGWLPSEGAQRWPLRRDVAGGWSVQDPDRGVTRLFAAADGQGSCALLEVRDRYGNSVHFEYSDAGMVSELRHSAGYRVSVASAGGLVTGLSVCNDRQNSDDRQHGDDGQYEVVASFGYDALGQLVRRSNPDGAALTLQWASGRIIGWRDRNDIWYRYTYDEAGRCVRTAGRGRVLSYGFSYLPGRTLVTDSLGAVSTYEYNVAGQVTRTVDPLGHATASVWDRYDHLLLRTDPLGRCTQFDYDHCGRLAAVTCPDGSRGSVRRNERGDVIDVVDVTGAVWTHTYDPAGNAISSRDPQGGVTSWMYTSGGAVETVTDPLGAVTTVESNAAGLPVAVSDPLGAVTRLDYDACGRVVRSVDPLGGSTCVGWTANGLPAHRVGPDGARQEWVWDQEGNLTGVLDPAGGRTTIDTGVFDLPVSRTGPGGGRMSFGYDTELRLTVVQNPAGLRWRYQYDPAGRLVAETDFNGRTQRYRYDPAGQLTGVTNGLGQHTRLTYDQAGNLVERATVDGVTRLTYDRAGRLLTAQSPGALVELRRDAAGRVVQESVNGRCLTVGFDAAGRRVSRRTPAGVLSQWQFDRAGRPAVLTTAGQALSFGHDAAGREVLRGFTGGGRLEQRFDHAHRLVSQVVGVADDSPADRVRAVGRSFHYRVDGALTGADDTPPGRGAATAGRSRRFDLDVAGRVVGVRADGWTERYAYDLSGRLAGDASQLVGGQPATVRAYQGTLVTRAGAVSYRHDRQGRVVTRTRTRLSRKAETWQFRYDADDRMVEAMSAGQRWGYSYDPFGRRISKQRHGADGDIVEQTVFSWDGDQLIEQTHTAATGTRPTVTTWDYLPGTWTPISQTVRNNHAHNANANANDTDADADTDTDTDAQFYAVVSDVIGTPTELVTPDGRQIAWTGEQATVWGAPRHKTANTSARYGTARVDCPIRFPGQYAHQETGLHYNRYRYYDPAAARYTTPDPLGLAPADDPHAYVPNPTGWADPLGLTPCDPADLLGHEGPKDGHTIDRHVGKSNEYLAGRNIPEASTFPDLETASGETAANLERNAGGIRFWLKNMVGNKAQFGGRLTAGSGKTYVQQLRRQVESSRIRTDLRREPGRPCGYTIITSFPER